MRWSTPIYLLVGAVCGASLLGPGTRDAQADILVMDATVTGMQVSYCLQVDTTESIRAVDAGTPPADYSRFTIFDFPGFIPGSNVQPPGWEFSTSLLGPTPPDFMGDDPALLNLTWSYTGAVPIPPGSLLGIFSVGSTLPFTALGTYSVQADIPGGGMHTYDLHLNAILVPAAVPEPSSWLLLIIGLTVLGTLANASTQRR
jgi:hypothetical protein